MATLISTVQVPSILTVSKLNNVYNSNNSTNKFQFAAQFLMELSILKVLKTFFEKILFEFSNELAELDLLLHSVVQ